MKKINKSIIGMFGVIALIAVSVVVVSAKDGADDIKPLGIRAEIKGEIKSERVELKHENRGKIEAMRVENKEGRGEMKEDIKSRFEAVKVEVKSMREAGATPEEIKVKLDEVRVANQADREEFRKKIEEKRKTLKDDIKAEIETFKEGKKIKLADAAKVQVKQRLDTAFTKLSGAVGKFAGFDKRLSDEILSRKAKGLDVSTAEISLELARRALEESKLAISSVNAAVTASLDSTTGASKEAIKSVINAAVESLKATKEKYQEVIKSLPKVEVEVEAGASVTAETK